MNLSRLNFLLELIFLLNKLKLDYIDYKYKQIKENRELYTYSFSGLDDTAKQKIKTFKELKETRNRRFCNIDMKAPLLEVKACNFD